MAFLEVTEIRKTYEQQPLLCGASFSVERGEIACLLGSSGSGKTTLLRIIAGLESAESGQVWLEGQEITSVPVHRRGVGLMFQDYALFPHRTVAENVAFGLRMQHKSWPYGEDMPAHLHTDTSRLTRSDISQRVEEMLALVGLDGFGERDVNVLSGGERQRVALARSLAPRPRLLLLDEPLGALDRALRERLLEELPAILRKVGVTAISVTHDQEEAFALADRVILLHEGQVVQSGIPEAVYNAPATPWAARFLGLNNLVPAVVHTEEPPQVQTPLGHLPLPPETELPAQATSGTLLIHPWGLSLQPPCQAAEPSLPLQGAQVEQCTFHGAYYRLELTLSDCTLTINEDPTGHPPAIGPTITMWLDPAAPRRPA